MKKLNLYTIAFAVATLASCQQNSVQWVATTEANPFVEQPQIELTTLEGTADIIVDTNSQKQTIWGWGACFNELGKTSLDLLSQADQDSIYKELFAPGVGASFTICRMPIAANDFARDWYSYNETDGDFEMANFSIENDRQTLIPFIKEAQKHYPQLKIWASPWSPPTWMKLNKHYAMTTGPNNGLDPKKQGFEGTDMFIQSPQYLESYALYFQKFIEAYKQNGIDIYAVAPQNEFNSPQIFPSCPWTAKSLNNFIGNYLGPKMQEMGVEVIMGTMERENHLLVDTILNDPQSSKYVTAVGFQWAGKGAIEAIHKNHPNMALLQTESECGDGKNEWKFAMYTWSQMKHYLRNGASTYLYWNISLIEKGLSRWGWPQNSLVTVNSETNTFKFNHEYFLFKHFSKYVAPGARFVDVSGAYEDVLAFVNVDSSVVVIAANDSDAAKEVKIQIGEKMFRATLAPGTFNTFVI